MCNGNGTYPNQVLELRYVDNHDCHSICPNLIFALNFCCPKSIFALNWQILYLPQFMVCPKFWNCPKFVVALFRFAPRFWNCPKFVVALFRFAPSFWKCPKFAVALFRYAPSLMFFWKVRNLTYYLPYLWFALFQTFH